MRSPRTPLGELTTLPRCHSWAKGKGKRKGEDGMRGRRQKKMTAGKQIGKG